MTDIDLSKLDPDPHLDLLRESVAKFSRRVTESMLVGQDHRAGRRRLVLECGHIKYIDGLAGSSAVCVECIAESKRSKPR